MLPAQLHVASSGTVSTEISSGYCIYSAKWKRYEQTTVTIKKSHLETETTQVTINSNPLSYFANLLFKANPENRKEEKKIQQKESPTLLVARLTRYSYRRSSSCHPRSQIVLPQFTVQTVPPLCYAPVADRVKDRNLPLVSAKFS